MRLHVNLFFLMATTIAFGQESQHLEGANQSKSENDVIRIKEVREGLEMEVNVYPNPSNGLIYLEGLPGTTITIYSSQGVYVGTWVIDSGKHITTAELPQGSFLCVLSNGDKQVTKRVVVL